MHIAKCLDSLVQHACRCCCHMTLAFGPCFWGKFWTRAPNLPAQQSHLSRWRMIVGMIERGGWRTDKPTQAERLQTRGYQLFWSLQFSMCSLITWPQCCHMVYVAGSRCHLRLTSLNYVHVSYLYPKHSCESNPERDGFNTTMYIAYSC